MPPNDDEQARDDAAMRRFQAGDVEGFVQVVRRYQDGIYSFCYRRVGSHHAAEELAQEVFVRLYQAATAYRPTGSFKAYLLTIARNVCANHLRGRRPEISLEARMETGGQPLPDDADEPVFPLPELAVLRSETGTVVRAALTRLTTKQREVLELKYGHHLTYAEMAEVLECPVGTVRSRMASAYAALRRALTDGKRTAGAARPKEATEDGS